MFRCLVAEVFSLGGGHALSGGLNRALAWFLAIVVCVVLCLWTPWALYLMFAVRLASIVEAGRHGRRGPVGGRWQWKPMLLFVAVSFGFFFATRTMALQAYKVPSPGMSPTLVPGDFMMGDKLSLQWRPPARGEVVVFSVNGVDIVSRVIAVGGDEIAVRKGAVFLNGKAVPQRVIGKKKYITQEDNDGSMMHYWTIAAIEELGGHSYRVLLPDEVSDPWYEFPNETRGCIGYGLQERSAIAGFPMQPGPDGTTCVVPGGAIFVLGDNRGNSADSRFLGVYPASFVRARVVGIWLDRARDFSRVGAID